MNSLVVAHPDQGMNSFITTLPWEKEEDFRRNTNASRMLDLAIWILLVFNGTDFLT